MARGIVLAGLPQDASPVSPRATCPRTKASLDKHPCAVVTHSDSGVSLRTVALVRDSSTCDTWCLCAYSCGEGMEPGLAARKRPGNAWTGVLLAAGALGGPLLLSAVMQSSWAEAGPGICIPHPLRRLPPSPTLGTCGIKFNVVWWLMLCPAKPWACGLADSTWRYWQVVAELLFAAEWSVAKATAVFPRELLAWATLSAWQFCFVFAVCEQPDVRGCSFGTLTLFKVAVVFQHPDRALGQKSVGISSGFGSCSMWSHMVEFGMYSICFTLHRVTAILGSFRWLSPCLGVKFWSYRWVPDLEIWRYLSSMGFSYLEEVSRLQITHLIK